MSHLSLGTRLHEYRIDAVLGAGAFGVTYRANDTNLGFDVAIKEYFPDSLAARGGDGSVSIRPGEDREMYEWCRDRFLDEAKTLAQFRHPNIVRVSRYFQAKGTAYFVMDFEEGESLRDHLQKLSGPLPESRAREVVQQVLQGLKIVHDRRYLHRDIKPGNIYIRSDGSATLIDFGAARLEMSSAGDDFAGVVTPGYAPVEQYVPDGKQGPWSDLYAVGATLYRCLTGSTPVASVDRMKHLDNGQPDPISPLARSGAALASPALLDAIDWMMSIVPTERPQSVHEVLDFLRDGRRPARERQAGAPAFTYVPKQALRSYKILVAGPVGVGKTTAIRSLADAGMLTTEENATDAVRQRKPKTTVAMDYGTMTVSESERVHLYGIPGQERFNFMWEILQKGAIGLVLLVDNSRQNPLNDLEFFLRSFRELIRRTAVVIGVNRLDRHATPSIFDYHRFLRSTERDWKLAPPVMEVDPRSQDDMQKLVLALLYLIDPGAEGDRV